ncbi:hypothetical protein ABE28_015165 [Peribacillus muralis]|uniref:Intracellular proteinase inhibitor BsuPI domain-containing protein n=1 Tax=Peribacillus muralis TaxID=264697 RepID=A0A1B3XR44_9BACI|nr:hypothetical protein [Peribacillus muralis]AOH55699.1 hypothetical protein ABE28_015165 [Peribacillus muralis]
MSKLLMSSIVVIVSISLIAFGYYSYIAQMDKGNNAIELSVEQSLEHRLTEKDYEIFTYKIANKANKNVNLRFDIGDEIDVEIHSLKNRSIKGDTIITVEPQPTKEHYKELKKGETWEYTITIHSKLLSKGDYQLTAQFIPSNAMTLNKVEQIITQP